jgi:hypothetical protein
MCAAIAGVGAGAGGLAGSARATDATATLTDGSTTTTTTTTPTPTPTPGGDGGAPEPPLTPTTSAGPPVIKVRPYTYNGKLAYVELYVSRPGTLTVQLLAKPKARRSKTIAYGKKIVVARSPGRLLVQVKVPARVAKRYRATPRRWTYSVRVTHSDGTQRYVHTFAVKAIAPRAVTKAFGYTYTGEQVNVEMSVTRPGTLTIQLFVKPRTPGATPVPYARRTMRAKRGRVRLTMTPTPGLARRYRANPKTWVYSGRVTHRAGKKRFAMDFKVRVK